MNEVLKQIEELGIVPVVVLNDAKDAEPLAKALCEGGLPCAEVTFRTDAAEESIRIMAEKFPDMLVGAGTVLTTEQVDRAVAAGAKFIVSPGLNPKVVKYCVEKGITITPGCANPSDVEQAIENGLEVVKFFPAEQAGGDYYDTIQMSNNYWGFVVADVSGHGTPAAVIMAITRYAWSCPYRGFRRRTSKGYLD